VTSPVNPAIIVVVNTKAIRTGRNQTVLTSNPRCSNLLVHPKAHAMPIHDLSNKIVLITGIGCIGEGWGNGTTMATLFARQGAIIFGCDINLEAANKAAEQIRRDPEVVGHYSRKSNTESSIVDVLQQSTVRPQV